MVRIKHKFIHIFSFLLLLCLIFATSAVVGAAASTREGELITTRNEFEKALNAAKDPDRGRTGYSGDPGYGLGRQSGKISGLRHGN